MNSIGHPIPEWPHGAATVEWAKQKFLQNRLVQISRPGHSIHLDQVTPWQGVADIDQSESSGVWLPTNPVLGDIVDVFVARGGPCVVVFAGEGGGANIDNEGSTYPFSGEGVRRFVCTNATGPQWSAEVRSLNQWADAVNSTAIGLALQSGGLGAEVAASLAGSRTAVWRPFDDPGVGYFTEWADVVAAVNAVGDGPTTIQIEVPSNQVYDTVLIPGGTWQLNHTTIVGMATNADNDTSYRGYQDLLNVMGAGASDPSPTWLKGCVGLKDMFFRSANYNPFGISGGGGSILGNAAGTVSFTTGGEYQFSGADIGKTVRIGNISPYPSFGATQDSNNTGEFVITNVVDASTFQYYNASGSVDSNNGDLGWSVCTSVFMVTANDTDTEKTNFVLDNVDFRYGGDQNWGSFHVADGASVFVHMMNGASVRWFGMNVDGYLAIQSDGGGSWVGSLAFAGRGHVDVFPMSGTQVRSWQDVISSWTLHQPTTVYIPNNTGRWDSAPSTIHDALDYLADTRLRVSNNLSDVNNSTTARNNLGAKAIAPYTRVAPGSPGATASIAATSTPAVIVDGSGCTAGTITSRLLNGDVDGQEITLTGGPWGADVFWDIKPDSQAFQSGNTIRVSGLAGSVTLKWWTFGSAWFIISQRGLMSIENT